MWFKQQSTTVDIHEPLELGVEIRCPVGVSSSSCACRAPNMNARCLKLHTDIKQCLDPSSVSEN